VTTSRTRKKFAAVSFVGVGPGNKDLLTVRAAELLRQAELVAVDRNLRELVVDLASSEVELLDTSKLDVAERAKALVAAAKEGRSVVRVLAGDGGLFGGLAEEADAVAKAKVPVEIVPGVPTAAAVSAYAGIPLVDKKVSAVHVVDLSSDAPEPDWSALAGTPGTLVLLNCGRGIGKVAAALIEHGRKPETAIAVTVDGATRQQHTVVSTLDSVDRDAAGITAGVAVVGDVVRMRDRLSWWETKPLFGWRVLVPRTREQAGALSEQLASYGAIPVEVPTIAVEPPRTPQAMDRAIRGLVSGRYAWVAFTSVNAVRAVREKLEELSLDARALAGVKVACVGDQTAAAVIEWGIRPELVPSESQSSEGLLAEFPAYDAGYDMLERVLLPRADIATETLAAGLLERGWQVDDVTAYRTVRAAPPPVEIREAIKTGGFDAVLFTSSSTVRNLVGIAGKPHASSIIAVIGPATADTAKELGLRVDVTASKPSASLLVEALADFGRERRDNDDPLPPGKANRTKAAARLKRSR
jgi:uroporphyrinogen III methyltransferase/synthase